MIDTGSRDVTLVRAPALPAQPLDRSPRTRGTEPTAVLRLAPRPGGRFRKGGGAPLRGHFEGRRPGWKKAVVKLQPGHKIELVEGA